jgi:hypothetical protein
VQSLLERPIGAVSFDGQRNSAELVLALHDWITQTGARLDLSS